MNYKIAKDKSGAGLIEIRPNEWVHTSFYAKDLVRELPEDLKPLILLWEGTGFPQKRPKEEFEEFEIVGEVGI